MRVIYRLGLLAGILGLVIGVTRAAEKAPPAAAGKSQPGPYSAAAVCGKCHTSIYKYWSQSVHSLSASNPEFTKTLEEALRLSADPAATRARCVGCHAPTTLITGDRDLKDPVSREGVTCDFCHTVKDVDLELAGNPFSLDPGPVKRGPFAYSRPFKGHEAAYSFLHRASPLICAACHEFRNEHGIVILNTYSEWKASSYAARGVSCQDCHMALVPGTVVKEGLEQREGPRVVNLHRLVGGSSLSQLNRGLDLKIESFSSSVTAAEFRVAVSNVAAGHYVPGGLPTKSLALVALVEDDATAVETSQEVVYQRELRDSRGWVLKDLPQVFLRATAQGQDTRLKPGDTRKERFRLPLSHRSKAVVVRLEYRDASVPGSPAKISLISQIRKELKTR